MRLVAAGEFDGAQLGRLRMGVRAALALAVAATVSANVLHAQPTLIGRVISAWAPTALLIAIEIITRIPLRLSLRAVVVWLATTGIAGIAAWVSYWHMVAVCDRYGEDTVAAHLIPLSVDGLVVVTSVYLVEINRRLRQPTETAVPDSGPAVPDNPAAVPDSGDGTPPTPPATTLNGTGGQGPNGVLPHLGPPPNGPVPDRSGPVPDSRRPVPDGGDGDPDDPDADETEETPPDPDPLLPMARELSRTTPDLSRTTLIAGLRDRGERCGTERARRLLATLATERDTLSRTAGTVVPDRPAVVPDSGAP